MEQPKGVGELGRLHQIVIVEDHNHSALRGTEFSFHHCAYVITARDESAETYSIRDSHGREYISSFYEAKGLVDLYEWIRWFGEDFEERNDRSWRQTLSNTESLCDSRIKELKEQIARLTVQRDQLLSNVDLCKEILARGGTHPVTPEELNKLYPASVKEPKDTFFKTEE